MTSVKIGPNYFKKEFADYNNWHWAYIREALQNCIDAPSSNAIEIKLHTIEHTDPTQRATQITFSNNGKPMDIQTIEDKLLSLGETGKGFDGTVGGFGKAKVILYFAQQNYHIHTGEHLIIGEGGNYEIKPAPHKLDGTKSTVTLITECSTRIIQAVKDFAKYAQWKGTITLSKPDGTVEVLKCELNKGHYRRDLGSGKVYTNKQYPNKLIVRIGGIPMFTDYINYKQGVILELAGQSGSVLTSNRDGLQYKYSSELSEFVQSLSTDSRRALRSDNIKYTTFEGTKYHVLPKQENETPQTEQTKSEIAKALVEVSQGLTGAGQAQRTVSQETYHSAALTIQHAEVDGELAEFTANPVIYGRNRLIRHLDRKFVIKNCTDLTIPDIYNPGSPNFSGYAKKLSTYWGNLLHGMYKACNITGSFSIGFIFDKDSEAQYEYRNGEVVYYINPVIIERSSTGTRMSKRFKLTERNRLIGLACHEVTHLGNSYHDEDYACALTDNMVKVLGYNFSSCFSGA